MNDLETPEHRRAFRAKSFKEMHSSIARTSALVIVTATGTFDFDTVVYNCEWSTMSAFAIWLQEHGAVIPADICATLEIEEVNNA